MLVQEFITNAYQESMQAVLDKALAGDETNNFEFSLITKAGVHIEVVLNATTRHDKQGTVIGVVGICQDATLHLAQEWKYFKLANTTNVPIFCGDTQGAVNTGNQCVMHCVVYSTKEVMGKNRLIHMANAPISSVETFCHVNGWNMCTSRLIGYSTKEVMGRITNDFKMPVQTVDLALARGKTNNRGYHIEVLLYAMSGQDEQEEVIGMVGIG